MKDHRIFFPFRYFRHYAEYDPLMTKCYIEKPAHRAASVRFLVVNPVQSARFIHKVPPTTVTAALL